jgi:hypothetical protein
MHLTLGHQSDKISIAQAIGQVPADAGFDDISRESSTTVDGISINGFSHGWLLKKAFEYQGTNR